MTKVKICGLKRISDIEAANIAMPDFVGFVFAKSSRQVAKDTAKLLKAHLDPRIAAVGVFVNEDIGALCDLVAKGVIDYIQLHGDEDEAYIKRLRQETEIPLIKAVRVKNEASIREAQDIDCDYLLFDTWHKDRYGGSGKRFKWELLRSFSAKQFFLAGGITLNTLERAIHRAAPFALDISSGVEVGGLKDPEKMKKVVEKVRRMTHV